MTRIMIPMTKSATLTIALFTFVGTWNAYFWPLVMTTTDNVRPLTIGIEKLKDVDLGYNWPAIMAGNTMLVLPVLTNTLRMAKTKSRIWRNVPKSNLICPTPVNA